MEGLSNHKRRNLLAAIIIITSNWKVFVLWFLSHGRICPKKWVLCSRSTLGFANLNSRCLYGFDIGITDVLFVEFSCLHWICISNTSYRGIPRIRWISFLVSIQLLTYRHGENDNDVHYMYARLFCKHSVLFQLISVSQFTQWQIEWLQGIWSERSRHLRQSWKLNPRIFSIWFKSLQTQQNQGVQGRKL